MISLKSVTVPVVGFSKPLKIAEVFVLLTSDFLYLSKENSEFPLTLKVRFLNSAANSAPMAVLSSFELVFTE